MEESDNEWAKKSRQPKPSTKKIILDALGDEIVEQNSIGCPDFPTLPLVGSLNVPISIEEESKDE